MAKQRRIQRNPVTGGQRLRMFVKLEQELSVQARLAAGVLQLYRRETMRDRGPEDGFDRCPSDRVIHLLSRLVHVAIRAAQVACVGDMEPGGQQLALGEVRMLLLASRMNESEAAEAIKDVPGVRFAFRPGRPCLG